MTDPEDNEGSAQAQILMDADAAFRVSARRNRLLAHWAAEQMDLTSEESDAYSKAVIQSDFEGAGDEDVIRKVLGDLTAAGVEVSDAEIREALAHKTVDAKRQIIQASNS